MLITQENGVRLINFLTVSERLSAMQNYTEHASVLVNEKIKMHEKGSKYFQEAMFSNQKVFENKDCIKAVNERGVVIYITDEKSQVKSELTKFQPGTFAKLKVDGSYESTDFGIVNIPKGFAPHGYRFVSNGKIKRVMELHPVKV
jgi:hypothetical protein